MRLPAPILRRLQAWSDRKRSSRLPDFIIGGADDPYLLRWWVIPRNTLFNIYLHEVIRSDDDRALHDHPWINCSIILRGGYREHVIAAGGIHFRHLRQAGSIVMRRAKAAHRLEVIEDGERAITLFITGPRIRNWGFHCIEAGWRRWQDFVAPFDKGQRGRGCGETE